MFGEKQHTLSMHGDITYTQLIYDYKNTRHRFLIM